MMGNSGNNSTSDFDPFGDGQTPDAPAAGKRHFKNKTNYKGKVVGQQLYHGRNDVLTLTLKIALLGEMMDSYDPDSSLLDCPKVNVSVDLRFPEDDPDKLGYSIKDLQALGFDDSLEELPNFNLVGREVFITPKYGTYNGKESCFWNLRNLTPRDQKSVTKAELKKSSLSAAFKARKAEIKAEASKKATAEPPF